MVALAVALGACTVKKTEAPPLSGPSETGLSLNVLVTPDQLVQDGLSQSVIEMTARGPDGRPQSGVPLRVEINVNGVAVDYGVLSNKAPVTGSDGVARVTYTSPPALAEAVDNFTTVRFYVTPVGNDYFANTSRYADLRLVPRGVILPPNNAPVPSFVVSPTPVTALTPVTFDASGTRDENAPCAGACSYSWNFGDGSSGSGMVVSHEFRAPGTFVVRLTVIDARGGSATSSQSITVGALEAPKAAFEFSPSDPRFGQPVFFNATASTAPAGHRIVAYDWDFGTGRTGEGMTVAKTYGADLIPPGAASGSSIEFKVTLTVTDDTFSAKGVLTKSISIKVP
jgi:PKD repeat protein